MTFTSKFGQSPQCALLDFLADHPASDYPITELARGAELSRPTVYAAIATLVKEGLVVQTRTLGASRLFKINTDHAAVRAVLVEDLQRVRGAARAT